MTIIFGYFQYLDHIFLIGSTIPLIINACFYIVISYLIIRSSKTNLVEKERPELLYYIGVINIIFLLVRFIIPVYNITNPTDLDFFLELIYVISYGLIISLPSLITFGIFMFKFGKVNEQRFGSFLKISGILWLISTSINVIMLDGYLLSIIFLFIPYFYMIWYILTALLSISGLIILVAWILVIVHSVKNHDKNLLFSGILAFIAFGASYLYGMFILPILY